MVIFLLGCLVITLASLEILILSRFHSYSHRLLPLILGLIGCYNFYLIIEYMTGAAEVFKVLKDLLLIQILTLILYYVLDSMNAGLRLWQNIVIFTALLAMDVLVCTQLWRGNFYRPYYLTYVVIFFCIIIGVAVATISQQKYSEQMQKNLMLSLSALCIPAVAIFPCMMKVLPENIVMPIALAITCLIWDGMFLTDRLRDVNSFLKEELFQILDVPSFLFDADFFYLDASRQAKELFPFFVQQMAMKPEDIPYRKYIDAIIEAGGSREYKIEDRYYSCSLHKANYKNKIKGYILICTDVSELKKETVQAIEVSRQKSQFLANMSHDLRSPLHAIIGGSEIVLSQQNISEKNRMMINHVHDAGENLLDIVNSILDFSKLEDGSFDLHPKVYHFKQLLEEQAHIAFMNLKNKPVEFRMIVEDPFPEYLYGDGMRVRQIIQNLISNAIKFTDNGSVTCRFEVTIIPPKKVKITYYVEDTGVGMSREQIRNAFGSYISYSSLLEKEGTGLGLSIVRQLAEVMNGYAIADSDGSSGTTMRVQFCQELPDEEAPGVTKDMLQVHEPVVVSDYAQDDQENFWNNNAMPTYVYPKAKVLVADDMAVNLDIFRNISSPWQIQIDTAIDGALAVEATKEKGYDLIFLDQMMPNMTGIEAGDAISRYSLAPKILLTANIADEMQKECKEHGFDAFMHKPIDVMQLKEILEKYLPERLREKPDSDLNKSTARQQQNGYYMALKTYVSEMKKLAGVIREYAQTDRDLFRNKIHGIKGASKQLNIPRLAFSAEILEMAAITGNVNFIREHFDEFYSDLEYTIQGCEQELEKMRREHPQEEVEKNEVDDETLKKTVQRLAEALDSYELSDIEETLDELDHMQLSDEQSACLERIKEYYDDVEYELAAEETKKLLE